MTAQVLPDDTLARQDEQFAHVMVAGASSTAIEIALTLRRLGEPVTVLAEFMTQDRRTQLERSGCFVVLGSPSDRATLESARAAEARAMIICIGNDLRCMETAVSVHSIEPRLPLICCVADPNLAVRLERSSVVRSAIAPLELEAVHLAAAALHDHVLGAFTSGADVFTIRREVIDRSETVTSFERRTSSRVLMIDGPSQRPLVAPSSFVPLSAGAQVITLVRTTAPLHTRPLLDAGRRILRILYGSTPSPLRWAVALLVLLSLCSVFVFMAGMNVTATDALYLVMNTVSTVGYGDITPFGAGPLMRLFGSFVSLLGPMLLGALLLIFVRIVLGKTRAAAPAKGHAVIVAEAGAAQRAALLLDRLSVPNVIADPPEAGIGAAGYLDGLIRTANIRRAAAVVAATGDPITNVTIGLAAREINPAIRISIAGAPVVAEGMGMGAPASAVDAAIAVAASAALVSGHKYALTVGSHVFSFFEGCAGPDWSALRPSEVSGSYNFLTLFRAGRSGSWQPVESDEPFSDDENVLVVAWRPVNGAIGA